jgi:hypothetical protein
MSGEPQRSSVVLDYGFRQGHRPPIAVHCCCQPCGARPHPILRRYVCQTLLCGAAPPACHAWTAARYGVRSGASCVYGLFARHTTPGHTAGSGPAELSRRAPTLHSNVFAVLQTCSVTGAQSLSHAATALDTRDPEPPAPPTRALGIRLALPMSQPRYSLAREPWCSSARRGRRKSYSGFNPCRNAMSPPLIEPHTDPVWHTGAPLSLGVASRRPAAARRAQEQSHSSSAACFRQSRLRRYVSGVRGRCSNGNV